MLPSEAGPGQRIRLPGQTKVTTEEYKEFLGLGHGDIFDLDPDMCVSLLLLLFETTKRCSSLHKSAQTIFQGLFRTSGEGRDL